MNLDFLKNIPAYQKSLGLALMLALIVLVFFWFFYMPKRETVSKLNQEIARLESQIDINRAKANKLEELKKENAELQRQLEAKKLQLPPQAEVASLLKQISDLGLRLGLDFKLWRPAAKKMNPSGLYTEIPVDIEIGAGYHKTAMFFDSVSQLSRIVNITNINMKNPKKIRGEMVVKASFVATAFAQTEPKEPSQSKGSKKSKGKKKNPSKSTDGVGGH